MTKSLSKPLLMIAVGTAALVGVGGYVWYGARRPAMLELYVFDTPGHPSILLRTPDDKRALIGGGSNADIVRRLTGILPFYSRHIDMLIAPDTDAKSVTGLAEAIKRYDVGRVIVPAVTPFSLGLASSSDPAYEALVSAARDRGLVIEQAVAGGQISFGSGIEGSILFPVPKEGFVYSKASGPSIILDIRYGSTSILLSGAATTKVQRQVSSSISGHADALIFFHSLVASNISKEIMDACQPRYVVYSQAIGTKKDPVSRDASAARKKADPMAGILGDHRFNIRNGGEVKIVSDGSSLSILSSQHREGP